MQPTEPTALTQAVMGVSPVERPVASAAYGFVRFIGGGLAPFAAGRLVEHDNVHVPFYLAAGVLLAGIAILSSVHGLLDRATAGEPAGAADGDHGQRHPAEVDA
ncbi:hypothetical protein ABH931_006256 [Streptacidiphilus sp. MAP12-33]|uniref:hypothetical protein n=1 Tax=Streptacidiphilus sp. MAP12-33 TaxID=3156266 RepID=UPI003514CEB8